MNNGNDNTVALVDAIYTRLPKQLAGHLVDAEYNDDGSIQIIIGSEEYNLTVKKEK